MSRSKSSQRWLHAHFKDPYVKLAHAAGLRSRAIFKLKEIDHKYNLIKPTGTIIDLGAAPGGWSEYAAQQAGARGTVIALDILPMQTLPGVGFILGDFTQAAVLEQLVAALQGRRVDLVMSDMAPNMSGIKGVDQLKSIYLAELALEFATGVLNQGGHYLVKLFHGEGFDTYVKSVRGLFDKVQVIKPEASRAKSSEVYLLARHYSKT
ncbi:MAG: 23S rRNA methyltransferase [Gammaproteobacteria bacterium]|nr:23S rRNA methyltransferase [Gammaproteobacteria bacterium]